MTHSVSRSLLAAAGGILFATAAFGQQPPPGAGVRPVVKPQAVGPQAAPDNGLGMAQLGAFINGDGTVGFGAGVTGALRFSAGVYEIQFNRNITQCIYSANSASASNKVIQVAAALVQSEWRVPPHQDDRRSEYGGRWKLLRDGVLQQIRQSPGLETDEHIAPGAPGAISFRGAEAFCKRQAAPKAQGCRSCRRLAPVDVILAIYFNSGLYS